MPHLDGERRQLSAAETITDMLSDYGDNIVIHASMLRASVPLTLKLLNAAFKKLMHFQPMLQMRISSERQDRGGAKRYFVPMDDPIEPQIEILFTDDRNGWVSVAEQELSQQMRSDIGPLWKVKYVAFNHNGVAKNAFPKQRDSVASSASAQYARMMRQEHQRKTSLGSSLYSLSSDPVPGPSSRPDDGPGYSSGTLRPRQTLSDSGQVLYEGVLIFKIMHVIADAISLYSLIKEQFIPILNSCITKENKVEFSRPLFMLPPPEDAFFTLKQQEKWKRDIRNLKLNGTNPEDRAFRPMLANRPDSELPNEPTYTGLLPFGLTVKSTDEFLIDCAHNEVRVHAALLTASAMALLETAGRRSNAPFPDVQFYQMGGATGPTVMLPAEMIMGYTVDLRKEETMDGPYHPLGLWLGYKALRLKGLEVAKSPESFWEEARKIQKMQNEGYKPSQILHDYSLSLKNIAKSGNLRPTADLFRVHFQIDNLGNCDRLSRRSNKLRPASALRNQRKKKEFAPAVRMTEQYFFKSMGELSTVPLHLTVCTYRSRLLCTVVYNNRWIDKEFATAFVETFLTVINNVHKDPTRKRAGRHGDMQELDLNSLPPFWRAQAFLLADR